MRKLKNPSIKEMVQNRIAYHTRMITHHQDCQASCMMDEDRIVKAMDDARLSHLAELAVSAILRKKQNAIDAADAHRECLNQLQTQASQYDIMH